MQFGFGRIPVSAAPRNTLWYEHIVSGNPSSSVFRTLGDADVIFDAYSDAVTINVSYSNPLDEALVPQVISFFNRVNSTLYVGKLMVIKSDNVWYAAYEIFLSVDPENITDWDRNNVLAYTSLALNTLEEMVDYITEIANGESADNVFAMWQADIGAV